MENGGHAACAGVAAGAGVTVAGGVGKPGVIVNPARVATGAVRVTVFSGGELQATIDPATKIQQSNLNDIFLISIFIPAG